MDTPDIQRAKVMAANFLPNLEDSVVAVEAPGEGEGFWVGASSAFAYGGEIYLAYRMRQPISMGRGGGVVVAKSTDGEHFEQIAMIPKESMDAESLERPALLRTPGGKWRLYLSCATTDTKHWRVELLEADNPAHFDPTTRRVVMPGDEHWGVKDPVIQWRNGKWHAWVTFHPLDMKGHEDRMVSNYATSKDGVEWEWHGTALAGREGQWDHRGARVTAVQFGNDSIMALYDGRASAEENYEERTGIAAGTVNELSAIGDQPAAYSPFGKHGLRYYDIVPLEDGSFRIYYELAKADGSHELRTEWRPAA
jgi:hypothetical protein